MQAAERVREAFAVCGIEVDETPVATTVSIGVAQRQAEQSSPEEVIKAADQALGSLIDVKT